MAPVLKTRLRWSGLLIREEYTAHLWSVTIPALTHDDLEMLLEHFGWSGFTILEVVDAGFWEEGT